jgi:hypothetical protein
MVADSRLDVVIGFFFNLPNPSSRTRPWGLLILQHKRVAEAESRQCRILSISQPYSLIGLYVRLRRWLYTYCKGSFFGIKNPQLCLFMGQSNKIYILKLHFYSIYILLAVTSGAPKRLLSFKCSYVHFASLQMAAISTYKRPLIHLLVFHELYKLWISYSSSFL